MSFNYRKLNEKIIKMKYPLRKIKQIDCVKSKFFMLYLYVNICTFFQNNIHIGE